MSDATSAIVFEALFPDVRPPLRATDGSAGYDVRAHLIGRRVRCCRGTEGDVYERESSKRDATLAIAPGERALIPLGFKARLPAGHEAQVRLRSSIAFKKGLIMPNSPGTIDADYPDEWLVMMRNDASVPAVIEHNERIAQVILARFAVLEWESGVVSVTTRSGGVGSTGSA